MARGIELEILEQLGALIPGGPYKTHEFEGDAGTVRALVTADFSQSQGIFDFFLGRYKFTGHRVASAWIFQVNSDEATLVVTAYRPELMSAIAEALPRITADLEHRYRVPIQVQINSEPDV